MVIRLATASVSCGAISCMSASLLAIVTEICSPAGRSATRVRICSGRVSWRRRLCARFGGDAEVGADGGDPVRLAQPGAGLPAVGELLLLVCERELLALLAVGLDAADLLRRRGVVEQQHDQAADGLGEAVHVLAAGEAVAGLGGEVAALAVVEEHLRLVGSGRQPMQGTSWPLEQSIFASRSMPSSPISRRGLAASSMCSSGDALDPGRRARSSAQGADVEQQRRVGRA